MTVNTHQDEQSRTQRATGHRAVEMLLFLVASAVGIYSLGQTLTGVFEPGQGISLLWLFMTGVALMILILQMGRVHDTWPRRKSK